MKAIDFDIGDNGEVNYELLDRAEGVFQMHRKTGEITLMRTLNDPTRVFNLRIIADDGGMYTRSTTDTDISCVAEVNISVFACCIPGFRCLS